ncbi:hypothetical protein [Nocardioides bigeumensis]|uniref:Peptidase C39-like domain-containing protein n=1 Tax=Nocardioides bigeumensis TaxID=433657 RepID=A0ABN2YB21_9ACTN
MSDFDSSESGFDEDPSDLTDAPIAGDPITEGGQVTVTDWSGDADSIPDLAVEQLVDGSYIAISDDNGDQLADSLGVDIDGDGDYEIIVVRQGEDYLLMRDLDNDGVFEDEVSMTRADLDASAPEVANALDMWFEDSSVTQSPEQVSPEPSVEEPVADDGSQWVQDGQLVGDPTGDAEHWFEQAVNGFCVPASVAQIVSEYTGVHYEDEQAFVEQANELHVFVVGPDGVPGVGIDGAEKMLDAAGVPATMVEGGGMESLVTWLDEGRRVLAGVDSGEIWYGEDAEDNAADHAIVVTGVDLERGVVIVSDPGDPEGNQKEYPVELFEDAWEDSNFAAVVCDEPAGSMATTDGTEPVSFEEASLETQPVSEAGVVPSLTDEADQSRTEKGVEWLVQHPWVVIPVVLVASRVIGSRPNVS